jgi:hypothetical protein
MTSDQHQCRWHVGNPSRRCPAPQAFPDVREVPPFCVAHLGELEPWIATRATLRAAGAQAWIGWAARQAKDADHTARMLGATPLQRRLDRHRDAS